MLAPPWIPVSPTGCGGIEFVVAMLSDALVEQATTSSSSAPRD
jgi:hypothetical protein